MKTSKVIKAAMALVMAGTTSVCTVKDYARLHNIDPLALIKEIREMQLIQEQAIEDYANWTNIF